MMLAAALHANGDTGQACEEWKKVLWLQSGHGQDDTLAQEDREKLEAHCGSDAQSEVVPGTND